MMPECFALLFSSCAAVVFTIYIEAVLALQLSVEFNLSNAWIGLFFLFSAGTYVVGASLSSWLAARINRKIIIIFAFGMMAV